MMTSSPAIEETTLASCLYIRVLSSDNPSICSGPVDLSEVLQSTSATSTIEQRIVLQANNKDNFVLWLSTVAGKSPWTFQDGLKHATNFFHQSKNASTCFLYTAETTGYGKETLPKTHFAAIMNIDCEESCSVDISFEEWRAIKAQQEISLHYRRPVFFSLRISILLVFAAILACTILLVCISRQWNIEKEDGSLWFNWDVGSSQGLRHQLQFTTPWPSFYSWEEGSEHANTEWFVRIDDQTMYPANLADESEMKYQRWFAQRYPEMEAIRSSKDYLNSSFHDSPLSLKIPVDLPFHTAHCVRVLRRYWVAKETGRHVCPRDLDHDHVEHCLKALEDIAFIEGPRGSLPPIPKIDDTLEWLVSACF
ncbi:hypothetical protein VTL71DRAFT_9427 [Oculimacula yallundae]|uniref:Uncharacterized protein n=1 Tax=Oculimacula yallundae TaxID=86028 RepID=A0ABR4BT20_9HELO